VKLSSCVVLALLISGCSKPSGGSAVPETTTSTAASPSPQASASASPPPVKEGETCGEGPKPTASCEPPLNCILLPVSTNLDGGPGAHLGLEHAACGGVGGLSCVAGLTCAMPAGKPIPDQMGNCQRQWICQKDSTTTTPDAKSPAKQGESCGIGSKPTTPCAAPLVCRQVAIPGAAFDAGPRPRSSEHGQCGGIGGLQCAVGLVCDMPPDQIGVKDGRGSCARSWTCVSSSL
jgi:hypothetical protein